jgi:hypothetical protein
MAPSALPAAVFWSCGGQIWEQWWRDWVTTTETGLGNCGRRRDLGAAAVLRELENGGGRRMGMGRGLVKWQYGGCGSPDGYPLPARVAGLGDC